MQTFLEKGMIAHPNEIDESDDYYSDNEKEPNNDPENDEEADDENEAEFDFQEEAADPVDEMLHKKQVCMSSHFISNFKKRNKLEVAIFSPTCNKSRSNWPMGS